MPDQSFSEPNAEAKQPRPAPADAAPRYPFLGIPDASRDAIVADQLHHRLVGGPPSADSPYSKRELRLYVQQAREFLEALRVQKNKELMQADFVTRQRLEKESWVDDVQAREAGAVPDEWIQSFTVPVLCDEQTQEQYCDIPEAFLNLRRYQNLPGEEGITRVQHVTVQDRRQEPGIIKVPTGMETLLDAGLPCGLLGNHGHRQEGSKVRLVRDRGMKKISQKFLLLSGIVRGSRVSDLPEAPLKLAIDDWEVLNAAVAIAQRQAKEDKNQDQSSVAP